MFELYTGNRGNYKRSLQIKFGKTLTYIRKGVDDLLGNPDSLNVYVDHENDLMMLQPVHLPAKGTLSLHEHNSGKHISTAGLVIQYPYLKGSTYKYLKTVDDGFIFERVTNVD